MSEGHMLPTHNEPRIQTHSHTHRVAAWLHCRRSCLEEVLLMLTIVSSSAGMTGGRQLLLLGLQTGGVEEGLGGWRMSRQVKSQTGSMNINRRLNSVSFRRCFKPNVGQWRKSPQIFHFLSRVVYFLKASQILQYMLLCIYATVSTTQCSRPQHTFSHWLWGLPSHSRHGYFVGEKREKKGLSSQWSAAITERENWIFLGLLAERDWNFLIWGGLLSSSVWKQEHRLHSSTTSYAYSSYHGLGANHTK